jgi:nitrogen fixation/metabolism regulation signal transduction histidine kinase
VPGIGVGVEITINPLAPIVLTVQVIIGGLLMLLALRNSGGWANLWYGHRPVTWFVLAIIVPELAVILIAVNAVVERRNSRKGTWSRSRSLSALG